MEDALTRYIEETLLSGRREGGVSADTDLLTSGLLDSLGVMQLIWFIEQEFSVEVPPGDVTIENFQCVAKITEYLEGL